MKYDMINSVAIMLFCALCIFTGCTDTAFVDQVAPIGQDGLFATQVSSSDILGDQQQSGITPDEGTKISTSIDLTFSWESVESVPEHTHATGDSELREISLGTERRAYMVTGHAMVDHERLGPIGLSISIKSGQSSRSSVGQITVQSMLERASMMTFEVVGSADICNMGGGRGFPFILRPIDSSGSFSNEARYGSGLLTTDMEYDGGEESRVAALLNITFEPVLMD